MSGQIGNAFVRIRPNPAQSAMTARQIARAQAKAQARAERHLPRFERIVRQQIAADMKLASRRFPEYATVHVTAAGEPPGWTPPAEDELLALDALIASYRTATNPIRQAAVADYFAAFGQEAADVGIRASWEVTNPMIAAQLEKTAAHIQSISETTRLNIRGIILRAYQEGLSVPDTAAAIAENAEAIGLTRATMIARTEFAGLVNSGSLASVEIVGQATDSSWQKTWRTAPGAEHPRHEDYEGLDGQTVPTDGLFQVGDAELAYPGDPDGDPGETINCRCSLQFRELGDGAEDGEPSPEESLSQDELASLTTANPGQLADAARGQALQIEPALTTAMKDIASAEGAELPGLRFRFKAKDSMARKIRADANIKEISDAASASQITDAVRYTFQFQEADYAAGYERAKVTLEARGFREIKAKNKWLGDEYKGVNAIYETPGGYRFEIQFHTPESTTAVGKGHPLYERKRKLDPNSAEAKKLQDAMRAIWAQVSVPDGALGIGRLD